MNKRTFFKSLALIGAGASMAPGLFIPRFEPVRWKVAAPPYMIFRPADYMGEWEFVEFDCDSVPTLNNEKFYDTVKVASSGGCVMLKYDFIKKDWKKL